MTELSEHRRKLIKNNTVRGTLATIETETNSITLPSCSGVPIQKLEIKGNTYQKTTTGKNLIDVEKFAELVKTYDTSAKIVEMDGRRCLLFYNHTLNAKDFTACCPVFKEKTRYIFSFEIRPYTILAQGENYGGRIFIRFKPEKTEIASLNTYLNAYTTEFQRMYLINKANTTITDIGFSYGTAHRWLIDLDTVYLYEYEGNDDPPYEEYTGRIPSPNAGQVINKTEIETVSKYIDLSNMGYVADNNTPHYMLASENPVSVENVNYLVSASPLSSNKGDVIAISSSQYGLLTGEDCLYLVMGIDETPQTVQGDFYIGVGNVYEGIPEGSEDGYWQSLLQTYITLSYQKETIVETITIPAFPQPIENSSNLSVELSNGIKTKVSIPSEITSTTDKPILKNEVILADGTVVPLRFAKVDDSADTLIVDKISNKVKYIKKIAYGISDGTKLVGYYKNSGNSAILYDVMSSKENGAKGLCNYSRVASIMMKDRIRFGADTSFVYWLGILDTLGFTNNWVDKSNPTSEETTQALTDFRAWLAENPTYIYYELSTPIEYDLTDTELGQQLLKLSAPYGHTGTIEVNADLEISGVKAMYYSLENEDKLSLIISCVDEKGILIAKSSHSIRAGSKYKVVAPKIEGYLPLEEEIEGEIAKNKEITIIYKEK